MYTVTNWPNRDPIREQGGLNLYAMVENDPVNYMDPFGLFAVTSDSGWKIKFDTSRGVACDSSAPSTKTLTMERSASFSARVAIHDDFIGENPNDVEGDELNEASIKTLRKLTKVGIVGRLAPNLASTASGALNWTATYVATKEDEYECTCSYLGLGSWEWSYKGTKNFIVSKTRGWKKMGVSEHSTLMGLATDDSDDLDPLARLHFVDE